VSSEILGLLSGPWRHRKAKNRCLSLHAELESFVRGDQIAICLEPYKAGKSDMGRLDRPSDEVWDFRAVRQPGLRVFGRFAEPDVFVALTCWPRSRSLDWLDRPPLLDTGSRQFRDAIDGCKEEWVKLFNSSEPFIGGSPRDYITENVLPVGD